MCLRFACINDHPSKNQTVSIIGRLGGAQMAILDGTILGTGLTICCNGARQASFLSLLPCYMPRPLNSAVINPQTNRVSRIYPLNSVTSTKSCIDDICFRGKLASITDAGVQDLMVLDLESGCRSSSIHQRERRCRPDARTGQLRRQILQSYIRH